MEAVHDKKGICNIRVHVYIVVAINEYVLLKHEALQSGRWLGPTNI